MIDYISLLLFNSFFITGLFTLFQEGHLLAGIGRRIDNLLSAKIHPEQATKMYKKGLLAPTRFTGKLGESPDDGIKYAYFPVWKSIKGCYECMASLWGTLFFAYAHLFLPIQWELFPLSFNLVWILPIYLVSLVALNRLIGRFMDL